MDTADCFKWVTWKIWAQFRPCCPQLWDIRKALVWGTTDSPGRPFEFCIWQWLSANKPNWLHTTLGLPCMVSALHTSRNLGRRRPRASDSRPVFVFNATKVTHGLEEDPKYDCLPYLILQILNLSDVYVTISVLENWQGKEWKPRNGEQEILAFNFSYIALGKVT